MTVPWQTISIPTWVSVLMIETILQRLVDRLGCVPAGDPTIVRVEGGYGGVDSVTRMWARGSATIAITLSSDHDHPPMESADCSASFTVSGLPGRMELRGLGRGNGSRFEGFTLHGEEAGRPSILDALASTFTELLREHSLLASSLLVPESWETRARSANLGDLVKRGATRANESWVVDVDGDAIPFAARVRGELDPGSKVYLDAIGPIPRVDAATFFSLARRGRSGGLPPLRLLNLAKALDDELAEPTLEASAPHHVHWPRRGEKKRFRAGPWVLLENDWNPARSDHPDQRELEARIHSEAGDPWCLLIEGSYRPDGFAKLSVKVLGASATRAALEARLERWLHEADFELTRHGSTTADVQHS